jgi:SAM-dependent methyltransferase
VSVNPSSRWSALDYASNAAFVPALGEPALALLAPQGGELILDLGCGDGKLTQRIEAAGAKVIGLDASPEMVEAARARGVEAYLADAQALDLAQQSLRFGQFDAAFSNAALHWMLDPAAVARGVFDVLKAAGALPERWAAAAIWRASATHCGLS